MNISQAEKSACFFIALADKKLYNYIITVLL